MVMIISPVLDTFFWVLSLCGSREYPIGLVEFDETRRRHALADAVDAIDAAEAVRRQVRTRRTLLARRLELVEDLLLR